MSETNKNNAELIIKKYKNRKLYDTEQSQYVCSEDIIEFVRQDKKFKVIDEVTKDDVTRGVLMSSLTKMNNLSIAEIIAIIKR